MSWLPSRRVLLLTVTALTASVLTTVPAGVATAAPAVPVDVLLPAPVVSPTQIPAGTIATVTGARCVPQQTTHVLVSLTTTSGTVIASSSVTPAADGTWTAHVTPAVSTAAGSYAVSATCDRYASQAAYRARPVTVTASTAAPWTPQTPALPDVPNGKLFDVDCIAAAAKATVPGVQSCVAVGLVARGGVSAPLVERYDGTSWTVDTITAPVAGDAYLTGVDCPTTTRCVAVGDVSADNGHRALSAVLSGTTWTTSIVDPPAGQPESSLDDVSCPTAAVCFAIGSTGYLSEGSRYSGTAYRLQGTTWTQINNPVAPSQTWSLSSLSCVNTRTCVAVGNDTRVYPTTPIAEVFDGTFWHTSGLAAVDPSQSPYLSSVSCATVSSCVAVGSTVDGNGVSQPLVETLSTTTWRRTPVAVDSTVGGRLQAVSCTAAKQCTAVGSTSPYQAESPGRSVAARIAGGGWSSTLTDLPAGELTGLSCVGTCVAVGDAASVPLVAVDTGTGFADAALTPPSGYAGGEFDAVSCSGPNACTAGGSSSAADPNAPRTPLVNRWNGTAWTLQSLPPVGTGRINGIACPSTTRCIAVGRLEDASGTDRPLVLLWVGGTWRQLAVRPARGAVGSLSAVSCSSATVCLAVGQSGSFGGDPLAVSVNNVTATVTSTPPVGDLQYVTLGGVSCVAGGTCHVLGYGQGPDFDQRGIDLVWTGSGFVSGTDGVGPAGPVSCVDASTCVALSRSYSSGEPAVWVLAGGQWRNEPIAYPASYGSSDLHGVSCRAGLACVVVGSGPDGAFVGRRSTSGVWTQEPVSGPRVQLQGVSCPTDTRCVAVGGGTVPSVVVSPGG